MNVNPWVIPGSFQNLPEADGNSPGFHFVFRLHGNGLLYVTHRMTLSVDGAYASSNLQLKWKGLLSRAADLPETTWVCHVGDPIEVMAQFPHGLKPGLHHIRLEVVSGGNFGGNAQAGKPWVLCEFEDDLH